MPRLFIIVHLILCSFPHSCLTGSSQKVTENLYKLTEYHPRTPKLYRLPKTKNAGIPMFSIIPAIGSPPDKLAKAITKYFNTLIETFNPSRVKYSGNLIVKLENKYDNK